MLTGLGDGLPLLTLQPADRPWETRAVLPAAWALAVWATRQFTSQDPAAVSSQDLAAVPSQDPAAVSSQDPVSGATTTGSLATFTVHDRP